MRVSVEAFSTAAAAIHAAAAQPERWPEALFAVALLVDGADAPGGRARSWITALAGLDRLGFAAFILDANGAVREMNERANKLLCGDPCVHMGNARLRFSDAALNTTFEAALHGATWHPPRSSLFRLRGAHNELHEVTVSPLYPAEGAPANTAGLALAVVARSRPDADHVARRVRRLYGLTDAEARVAAALALGETVCQIAVAYGVRISTVRAQVRSIFEKTGVHRQSDLVRLALTAPPQIAVLDAGDARANPPARSES